MIRSVNGKTPKIAESAFVSEWAYVVGDVDAFRDAPMLRNSRGLTLMPLSRWDDNPASLSHPRGG